MNISQNRVAPVIPRRLPLRRTCLVLCAAGLTVCGQAMATVVVNGWVTAATTKMVASHVDGSSSGEGADAFFFIKLEKDAYSNLGWGWERAAAAVLGGVWHGRLISDLDVSGSGGLIGAPFGNPPSGAGRAGMTPSFVDYLTVHGPGSGNVMLSFDLRQYSHFNAMGPSLGSASQSFDFRASFGDFTFASSVMQTCSGFIGCDVQRSHTTESQALTQGYRVEQLGDRFRFWVPVPLNQAFSINMTMYAEGAAGGGWSASSLGQFAWAGLHDIQPIVAQGAALGLMQAGSLALTDYELVSASGVDYRLDLSTSVPELPQHVLLAFGLLALVLRLGRARLDVRARVS